MIFLVKVKFTEYEQINKLIISANSAEEALNLANFEIDENNESLGISSNHNILDIEQINLKESKVLLTQLNW